MPCTPIRYLTTQKIPSQVLQSHNFWLVANTSENHRISVRLQKEMRLVSLEIPEPGATAYQNLMRQNPKLTRNRATKSGRRLKCGRISRKAAPPRALNGTRAQVGAGKGIHGTSLLVSGSFRLARYSGGTVMTWARPLASYVLRNALLRFVVMSQSY